MCDKSNSRFSLSGLISLTRSHRSQFYANAPKSARRGTWSEDIEIYILSKVPVFGEKTKTEALQRPGLPVNMANSEKESLKRNFAKMRACVHWGPEFSP